MTQFPLGLPSLHFSPLRYRPHGVGDWSGHIPFACDLIASLRPSVFVELGTHFGESYFAFCQAIAENSTNTKAYAVDTWQGDVHTGAYGDDVFREVDEHNRDLYSGFSRLMRMRFDEAAATFETGSIDLLHIDGVHTYEAVRHDFDTWWPKVRPGGIVLLHDSSVRQADFGVWKLLEELRQSTPTTEFFHSNGLGVVSNPGEMPEKGLLTLLFGDQATLQAIRRYYEICADHLEHKFWSARQQRPADQDITAQLFWRSEGDAFTEQASVRAAHTITAERSRIALTIPQLGAPPAELHLKLSHERAFIELHTITVLDARSDVLWKMQAAPHIGELRRRGLHAMATEDSGGVLVLDAPAGASFVVPMPTYLHRILQSGGKVIVEMSGLDPWCFASKMYSAGWKLGPCFV